MNIDKNRIKNAINGIRKDIPHKYAGNSRNRVYASLVVSHCEEWALSKEDWSDNIDEEKNNCKKHIKEKLKQESRYGSLLISILLPIVFKLVAEWIINKILEKIYSDT